jgi:hypothetical protein
MQNREGQFLFAALREASRSSRINQAKMKLGQIKPANKNIDHEPDCPRISNLPGIRKKRDLLAIHSLDGPGESRSHLPDPFARGMAAMAASV